MGRRRGVRGGGGVVFGMLFLFLIFITALCKIFRKRSLDRVTRVLGAIGLC